MPRLCEDPAELVDAAIWHGNLDLAQARHPLVCQIPLWIRGSEHLPVDGKWTASAFPRSG